MSHQDGCNGLMKVPQFAGLPVVIKLLQELANGTVFICVFVVEIPLYVALS